MLRTHTCGELRNKHVGKKVALAGWIDKIRNFGKLWFIDLRDKYGKTQIILREGEIDKKLLKDLTIESCIGVRGKVSKRKDVNKDLETGDVEVSGNELDIYGKSLPMPFELNDEKVSEDLRLKYRYLDLRSKKLGKNLYLRHKIVQFMRDFLDKESFMEVTTPILTKSTPEGARDFIVPSRIHPGKFYALPQSPQQYKQLLMIGGIDKYFQIAPCFRDEDARADRSPGEFYQLDLEMSFAEQKDILDLMEKMLIKLVKEILPEKKITNVPFPRLTYNEVMKKYGTDKPDLRKNKKDKDELAFCWIIDFPLFEEKKENGHFAPKHHMFTMPKQNHWELLNKKEAHKAEAYQHDLVLNGFEVGGGSVRIHLADIQERIFELIGFDEKDSEYFNHMLEAFKRGVPPHGGIAPGIDRLIMVLLGEPSLREVIAFPKNKNAQDVLMDAPSLVKEEQLKEVNLKLDLGKKKNG